MLRSRGLSSRAARAGLSVSELKAEIIVEIAIVRANCRKNWPVMPRDKRAGHEHRRQHQANRDHRPGDLLHRLDGRIAGAQAVLDVVLDRLDDHDGVIDHDADGQHQTEQRQIVQAEAHDRHDGEGADDGHRHGDQRNDRRAPVLQEDQHDEATRMMASRRVLKTSLIDSRMKGVVS